MVPFTGSIVTEYSLISQTAVSVTTPSLSLHIFVKLVSFVNVPVFPSSCTVVKLPFTKSPVTSHPRNVYPILVGLAISTAAPSYVAGYSPVVTPSPAVLIIYSFSIHVAVRVTVGSVLTPLSYAPVFKY